MGFPTPSVAHHLGNAGSEELTYLMGGDHLDLEIADFPKLGKRTIRREAWLPGEALMQTSVEVVNLSDLKSFGPLEK